MLFSFDASQRRVIADKVMELANLAFAGLVIGQVVTTGFDLVIALGGLLMLIAGYLAAFIILKGGGK